MWTRGWSIAALTVLGLARAPSGCGDVDHPEGRANAPCTRNKDCHRDLVCSEGVCRDPDAPPINDAGAG